MHPPGELAGLTEEAARSVWQALADRVLEGGRLTQEEGLAVLRSPDGELLDVLSAAFRVRRRWFGKTVQLYFLMNAKSGLCPEDCAYCSQSKVSKAQIRKYNLVSREKLLEGAERARRRRAKTYCMVISARGPTEREIEIVEATVPEIKRTSDLKVCASLGLLDDQQARRLKACGVDRINHNLNTSESFYSRICSTHDYQDRIATLQSARRAGLELCSGGIIGMGEEDEDVVNMALELRGADVQSIPLNFFHPIPGTPLESVRRLNPLYCLKVLALFRLANPDREIRIAGGRELHLRSLQPLGLYAANSLFVGDYLTTPGQPPEMDCQMIEDLGFVVTRNDEVTTNQANGGRQAPGNVGAR